MLHTCTIKGGRVPGRVVGSIWLLLAAGVACEAARGAEDASGFADASSNEPSLAFEGLRVEELASDRAVFRFTTSRPTSCEAEYGPTPALGLTATDPDMEDGEVAVEHEVPLEDLTADTQYHLRARAEDESGAVFYSDAIRFRTLAAAASAGENVALLAQGARVVAVSSNFGGASNDEPWGANRAFDGQMSTEWSSAGDGSGAFIEIDLGQARTLIALGFRSRKMNDGSSMPPE